MTPIAGTKLVALLGEGVDDGAVDAAALDEAALTADEIAEDWADTTLLAAELNEEITDEVAAETAEETAELGAVVALVVTEATADVTAEGTWDVVVAEASVTLLAPGRLEGVKGPMGPDNVADAVVAAPVVAVASADSLTPGQPPMQFW